ncbi:hypothetical protein PA25_15100 [Pseudoalteromonas sp. A25]|uniref:CsiV family protein n=1 Tax=Pseudoalteromonas sp. A25 TaxID=116092 RepID=UPI00126045B3|nr:CsiV family protein [Pseudoalteromonas sp. A25]BBN81525.1 hypothetical protein PA25_15100 [Pseudoalteromonas sp. A25]
MKRLAKISLLFFILTQATSAYAQRWFEVELIAFEQQPSPLLREDFSLVHPDITGSKQLDLLTDGFNAQGQQRCLEGDSDFDPRPLTHRVYDSYSWACPPEYDFISKYDTLPLSPYAEPQEHMDSIYLLSQQQLQFSNTLKQLQRKGLKPLLHTGWRFPEQSQRRAPFIKIFAGQRFESPNSYKLVETVARHGYLGLLNQPFTQQNEGDIDHWQLEGLLKIHVKHYLYVTSDLDIRYVADDGEIQKARMSQFTRVYSGDIHYLDHPKLGIIFQIRKYKH